MEFYAFTRPGDLRSQAFARELGAAWAGDSITPSPVPLDGAIIFAPVGSLVPKALRDLRKGGKLVLGGIYMTPIPKMEYELLWHEKKIESVANLTRKDGELFFQEIASLKMQVKVHPYPLEEANQALEDLRQGRFEGAAVLQIARM